MLCRGSGDSMYTREARATREAPLRDPGRSTEHPRGSVRAYWGGGEAQYITLLEELSLSAERMFNVANNNYAKGR